MARIDIVVMEDASAILSLPDDPAILKQIIATRTRERDEANRRRDEAEIKALRLEVELLRLKKLYYGPRADRLQTPGDVAQMLLQFATDLEARPVNLEDLPSNEPPPVGEVRRVRRGRRNLAALENLPVNDITRAGCWAHARRKFVDAEKTQPAIAAEAVEIIRRLYAVEDRGKGMDVGQRLALRQRESVPILSLLKEKLFGWRDQLLPKHPMAEAVNYALNQWNELNVFTRDGPVPIDNNESEREMKRICLNRKNSLFVGNERGGQTAAILSSLTSSCRRHGIDPQRYLTQLLTNLPGTPISQLGQWLPDQWKQRNPAPSG